MSGKARPSLRSKTLENVRYSNLSNTDKECIYEVFKRYEEALKEREERQKGCVITLPCKLYDTVWQLLFEDRYPYPYRVDGTDGENLLVFQSENEWNCSPYPRGLHIKQIPLSEWGKTVFLTQDEANIASGRPLKGADK